MRPNRLGSRCSISDMSFSTARLLLAALSVAPTAMFGAVTTAPKPDAAQTAFFEKHIRPVLATKCYKCHSAEADKVRGGLLLDTRDGLRKGGDTGPAIVPGNPGESLLIQALHSADKDTAMPPEKSGGKLPAKVIADFEAWVKMGAPDPREGAAAEPVVKMEIDFNKAREFWAYKAPVLQQAPVVADRAWPRTDLDRFILAGLEAKGLKPVADADRRNLIRRVYFDLVGLPPTPEELEAFFRDTSPEAFAKVVDRLLASPQFGERWGRHWLDVARYAESTGKERNFTFPEAWRYRDYVIAAFNADKPYDEFIREQIAGDLLPAKDAEERNAHLIATGFLALGPKGLNERNRLQFQMDLVDEQIDVTSRAVLGLTAACARCHDHKFDPIPTTDYYALAGIFRSSRTFYGTAAPDAKRNRNGSPLLPLSKSAAAAPPAASAEKQLAEKLKANGTLTAPAAIPVAAIGTALAMGVTDGRPGDSPLYLRGEIDHPGPAVPRGFLTVLTPGSPPAISSAQSGRRELADWLASKSNPLTARVMVNRVWLNLFGEGLVRTPDNFGATGEKPTHPALLDLLATQFMRGGWSVKTLVRSIVLSRTYQLASTTDPKNYEADPDNILVWRMTPRRLDAEAIRDGILAASGQLERTPPYASVVAHIGDGYIGRGIAPAQFNVEARYRSVYLPIIRDYVPDVLAVFDFAEPSLVVAARETTNVPSQALFMMNSPFVTAQSRALAKRLLAMTQYEHGQRIIMAYMLTLSRPPTPAESARTGQYLTAFAPRTDSADSAASAASAETAWATFCQALFACAEFRYLK
jgi:cytochrome c553